MVVRRQVAPDLTPADPARLGAARDALEGVGRLQEVLAGERVWMVGGAVRDLLLGGSRADIDLVVEGDAAAVASKLGAASQQHERFGTASVQMGEVRVDIARARREVYTRPGALPEVEPASLGEDLARRDFTVNAMGLPLSGKGELLDPHAGRADLQAGVLRVLHARSFEDDPTRALRAARYAARLGLEVEPGTAELLRATDLAAVSADRVDAEMRRLLLEGSAPEATSLLARWGLAGIDEGAAERVRATRALLSESGWTDLVDPAAALAEAARPGEEARRAVSSLRRERPDKPSAAMALVSAQRPVDLLMARIAGAEWLDEWAAKWRHMALEINGSDLLEAGVEQGPALGRALEAALNARLDGEIASREEELKVALAAAAAT